MPAIDVETPDGRDGIAFPTLKVREYAAAPSIHRYVIVNSTSIGLTVFERQRAEQVWR